MLPVSPPGLSQYWITGSHARSQTARRPDQLLHSFQRRRRPPASDWLSAPGWGTFPRPTRADSRPATPRHRRRAHGGGGREEGAVIGWGVGGRTEDPLDCWQRVFFSSQRSSILSVSEKWQGRYYAWKCINFIKSAVMKKNDIRDRMVGVKQLLGEKPVSKENCAPEIRLIDAQEPRCSCTLFRH